MLIAPSGTPAHRRPRPPRCSPLFAAPAPRDRRHAVQRGHDVEVVAGQIELAGLDLREVGVSSITVIRAFPRWRTMRTCSRSPGSAASQEQVGLADHAVERAIVSRGSYREEFGPRGRGFGAAPVRPLRRPQPGASSPRCRARPLLFLRPGGLGTDTDGAAVESAARRSAASGGPSGGCSTGRPDSGDGRAVRRPTPPRGRWPRRSGRPPHSHG